MIFRLFRRDPRAATIGVLYGTIVAQARKPGFYLTFGVPDTTEGRFDMIVLHLALLCRRLGRGDASGAAGQEISQGVFDMFCRDMDDNLREMGVGDLTVPKRMQKFGAAFYGRLDVYDKALAAEDEDELAAALARNVLNQTAPSASARRLADYGRAAARRLDDTAMAVLCGGELSFPDPDAIEAPLSPPVTTPIPGGQT
jgi:cytochrome b pre-mRNA-processing protein 3